MDNEGTIDHPDVTDGDEPDMDSYADYMAQVDEDRGRDDG